VQLHILKYCTFGLVKQVEHKQRRPQHLVFLVQLKELEL
jgi:hypothetical protein